MHTFKCLIPLILSFSPFLVSCAVQNVTVDDAAVTGSIPQYLPDSTWQQGADCTACLARPDPQSAFNGTWHDTTFSPSDGIAKAIEFTFNGTAIYIFFILANTIDLVDTVTDMGFIIDEQLVGSFVHDPSTSTEFEYNVPVYINESMPSGQHDLRMEATGNRSALTLFDYLVYTTDTEDVSSTASSFTSSSGTLPTASSFTSLPTASPTEIKTTSFNVAPIVGGSVAGVVAFLVLISACMYLRRRQKRRQRVNQILSPGSAVMQDLHGDEDFEIRPEIANFDPFILSAPDTPSSSYRQKYSKIRTPGHSDLVVHNAIEHNKVLGGHGITSTTLASSSRQSDTALDIQPSADSAILRERVELLTDEVTRLRRLHSRDTDTFEAVSEAPPGYSEGRSSLLSTS